MKFWIIACLIQVCTFPLLASTPTAAEIIPDATLPNNSNATNDGSTKLITGGTQAGKNLFHSFEEFSVPTGGTVYFNNGADIQNIISRVTGGSVSHIDGLIRANGSANLFLINPNGIIFGSNARINIGGSLVASTASSISFADGTQFSTSTSQVTSLLTISIPIGLQLGNNPGAIALKRSTLNVLKGKTLAFVGADLGLDGSNLNAEEGRIELGSVGEASLVRLKLIDQGFALDYQDTPTFQDIKLSQGALVTVSGQGGGDVQLQGRHVTLADSSRILARTLGAEAGGDLVINGSESVELIGKFSPDPRNLTGLFTSTLSSGAAGNLKINTKQLIVRDGALVSTSSRGQGRGGNLSINASDSVLVSGIAQPTSQASALLSVAAASGPAGNITIKTGRLVVQDGAAVAASTNATGNGGNLTIIAPTSVEVRGTSSTGLNRSNISAAAREGFSPDTLLIIKPTGDAGDLQITTQNLLVSDGAAISVENVGSGNAGQLKIQASSITVERGTVRASSKSGEGGNIFVRSHSLQLRQDSNITATALGSNGNGGNININTDLLSVLEGSQITADAVQGRGGNIQIKTQGLFRSPDSKITATSDFGINGTVRINTLLANPVSDTLEPQSISEAPEIASVCQGRSNTAASKFVITGTGGIPPSPDDLLYTNSGWHDNSVPANASKNLRQTEPITTDEPTQLIEAQGLKQNPDGTIILTAEPIVPELYSSLATLTCSLQPPKKEVLPARKTAQFHE